MPYKELNLNPLHRRVGDCAIRAIAKALDQDWNTTYLGIAMKGYELKDVISGNTVWGAYLKDNGFSRHAIPSDHDGIYTVEDFANDHLEGTYVLALDGHVVCVQDGTIYDSWDSSQEIPHFYWANSKFH